MSTGKSPRNEKPSGFLPEKKPIGIHPMKGERRERAGNKIRFPLFASPGREK
jgi:hypothetical protein